VLFAVGAGSLGLVAAIARARPWPSPGLRRLALLGALAFSLQTALLDALVWPAFFPAPRADAPARPPHRAQERPLRLMAVGDILLAADALPLLERHGFGFAFAHVAPLLAGHDLLVGNLEGPITQRGAPVDARKRYVHLAPAAAAPALRDAGFDLLGLANNHAFDHGAVGLADTLRALGDADLAHFGAGADEAAALAGHVVERAGIRIGFLGFMERYPTYEPWRWFAAGDAPGVAPMDEPALRSAFARLRPAVDVLVASFHWGVDYAPLTPTQERFGRLAVDLGADLVLGHHPHVLQPVEIHRGVPIVYSLGNFTFGTRGRMHQVARPLRHGWIADATLDGSRVVQLDLVPILTDNRKVGYQPRPAEPGALEAIRAAIARPGSAPLVLAGDRLRWRR
jgi:poly-gamma-glutamate synthesis protein (capsule biosynthesis protein)